MLLILQTDSIQKLIRRMVMAWNNLKQNGFKGYMDKTSNDKGRDESKISRLEACGSDLRDKLIKLFDVLYLTHKVSYITKKHKVRTCRWSTLSPPFPAFQSCMNPGMGIGL